MHGLNKCLEQIKLPIFTLPTSKLSYITTRGKCMGKDGMASTFLVSALVTPTCPSATDLFTNKAILPYKCTAHLQLAAARIFDDEIIFIHVYFLN